jgi:uncharacterized membrane protein YgcG
MNMKRIIYWGTVVAALCVATGARADAGAGATITGDTITIRTDNGVTTAITAENASTVDAVPVRAKQKAELMAQAGDLDKQYAERLQSIIKRNTAGSFNLFSPNRAPRGLVICSSAADAKTLAAGEEDLSIMSRILEKAAAQPRENEEREAMGIQLFTMGNDGGVKNLLIEGYGAVFMLNVNYPLIGPATKVDEDETKDRTNSAWDETKHELYGQPSGDANAGSRQEYDPKRVENLKNALLAALKNASNIRNLKSDESVTVVVTSEGSGQFSLRTEPRGRKPGSASGSGGGGGGSGSSSGSGGGGGFGPFGGGGSWLSSGAGGNQGPAASGAVLTIRAKKSDIDAFAKGKLTPEEFRNKSTVILY